MLVQRIEQELAPIQEAVTQTQRLINKLPQTQDEDMQNALIDRGYCTEYAKLLYGSRAYLLWNR